MHAPSFFVVDASGHKVVITSGGDTISELAMHRERVNMSDRSLGGSPRVELLSIPCAPVAQQDRAPVS